MRRLRYQKLCPSWCKAWLDDHALTVSTATAKEAFAKAVEWHVTRRFTRVSITDSTKTYSIEAFALAMALVEIAKTINSGESKAEENVADKHGVERNTAFRSR